MPKVQSNQYFRGAIILTASAFIVKLLSAVYRVPFQNIVGDVGFYIYQQVYPIYGIALIFATSGFPVIISKLAVETEGGKRRAVAHGLQAAFLTLLFVAIGLFCLFFFCASWLAYLMGDEQLAPLIKVIAFTFLFLPFLSLWRGYFQSVGNMVPTAVSQMLEQVTRVSIILCVAFLFVKKGYSLYEVGRGALLGSLLGGAAGLLFLLIYSIKTKAYLFLLIKGLSWKKFYKTAQIVLIHGAVVCLSGMVFILFQLIDSFSVLSLLVHSGVEGEQAKALKGIFDRGQPLIQLGTVAASSFSLALVPLIASAWARNDEQLIEEKTTNALKITIVIGLGATVGLANIIKPTNIMLFANADGSIVLAILAIAIFFSSLIMVCSGILQGLGHVFAPAKYIFIGLLVKPIGNICLIPLMGTMGAAVATIFGLAVILILLIMKVQQRMDVRGIVKNTLKKTFVAAFWMSVVLQLWGWLFSAMHSSRFVSLVHALSGLFIGIVVYLVLIIKMHILTDEEISYFPFGSRLSSVLSSSRK